MTRPSTRRRYLAATVAAGITAIAGCGDASDTEEAPAAEEEDEETESEQENGSAAPGEQGEGENQSEPVGNIDYEGVEGSLSFVSPEDGDEVSSPVEVEMEVENFELVSIDEADAPEQGRGHLHVIVDHGCIDPSYVIPQEDGYNHLSEGGRTIELELEAGEHELCAQASDAIHNAYDLTDEITVEVTDGGDGSDGVNESDEGLGNEENGTNVEGGDNEENGTSDEGEEEE